MKLVPLLLATILLGAVSSAVGQEFGQWSWDGSLGLGGRSYDNEANGESTGRLEQQSLLATFGLDGFVIHPAILGFRLGLDAALDRFQHQTISQTDQIGYSGSFNLFQRSGWPIQLGFGHKTYSYGLESGQAISLFEQPESSDWMTGRFRLRQGIFKGLRGGFDRTTTKLAETSHGRLDASEFLEWSGGNRFLQKYRVEHQRQEWGRSGWATDDFRADVSARGDVAPRWGWTMTGSALERTLDRIGVPSADLGIYTLQNHLVHDMSSGDLLDVDYTAGRTSTTTDFETHVLTAQQLFRRWKTVDFGLVAGFGLQRNGDQSLTSPNLGAIGHWSFERKSSRGRLSALLSRGRLTAKGGGLSATQDFTAWSLGGSYEVRTVGDLELELEATHVENQVRQAGSQLDELPDLGTSLAGIGTENTSQARLTMRRTWKRFQLEAYGDWADRSSNGYGGLDGYSARTVTGSFQLRDGWIGLVANVQSTEVDSPDRQTVSAASGALDIHPWTFLSVQAVWQRDRRETQLAPAVDGLRQELVVGIRIGAIDLRGRAFRLSEEIPGGTERQSRGFVVSIERRFSGWLPIVSAPVRRGVIR